MFLGYSGLGISLWPNIIPPSISIWDAAGPPQSLGFTLVGALFIIPIILIYTAWSYYVFRGKVRAGRGLPLMHRFAKTAPAQLAVPRRLVPRALGRRRGQRGSGRLAPQGIDARLGPLLTAGPRRRQEPMPGLRCPR